jgi:hypothetical protein
MVGNYAVIGERTCSLSSLDRLRERFNPNAMQVTGQRPWLMGAAITEKSHPFFPNPDKPEPRRINLELRKSRTG